MARLSIADSQLAALNGTRPSAENFTLLSLLRAGAVDSRALTVNVSTLERLCESPAAVEARAAEARRIAEERIEQDRKRRAPQELVWLDERERDAQTAAAGNPDPERLERIARERAFWSRYVEGAPAATPDALPIWGDESHLVEVRS